MFKRDCKTCTNKIVCLVCGKKMCHLHEDTPKKKLIEGYFSTADGILCVECFQNRYVKKKK